LPHNVSDEEFARVVENAGRILYKKLGKLHGTVEDFQQQAAVWALEALPRYDPRRPLDGYIYSHVRNRALNWVRDNYYRAEVPCKACDSGCPCGADGSYCRSYARWLDRNRFKQNIASPLSLEKAAERTKPGTAEVDADERELSERIDKELPVELRSYYLRMLAGDPVPTNHRRSVQAAVAEILGLEFGATPEQEKPALTTNNSETRETDSTCL
jgi:DNA-directed RNA polymerase specialized sigma24 family protein